MSKCSKAEEKARSSSSNLAFSDLCRLAECYGFVFRRQVGSHRIYTHPLHPEARMNFQDDRGKAKPYQVQQLLDWIDARAADPEAPS